MNFEDLQKVWQCQKACTGLTKSDPEALLRELRVMHKLSNRTNLLSDAMIVGVEAFMVPSFVNAAIRFNDWSFYVMAFGCLFVGVFILADRWAQRRRRPMGNDTLDSWAKASLAQVKHELWRSKHVLWWYVLPLEIGFIAVAASMAGRTSNEFQAGSLEGWAVFLPAVVFALMCGGIGWCVWWLSWRTARKSLEPRRRELEELLESLKER